MAVGFPNKKKSPLNDAGFTLVEILCVLAVLGLTAGLVVLNLPRGEDPFKAEVQTFATHLNIAARDSAIDGRIRGIEINETGYDLLEYSGEWRDISSTEWNDVFDVQLSIEDQVIDFNDRAKVLASAEKGEKTAPLIHLDPTGGVTLFTLELEGRDLTYQLTTDLRGRVIAEPAQ